ncbi:uncharacterized protein TNCV_1573291 [Trichonephila clavipes]|uniref:Uncharacterized protein n=1 Tax=Trichonephila clavipes TaxID=2585209 RepID=A0A8X6VNX7_TRICX|nr:uncharacterized protein TNCV_1573291 [Trichonephila clavipes]
MEENDPCEKWSLSTRRKLEIVILCYLMVYYRPIETKNVELSAIPINLLSILNFLKLNPKDLVGSIKHRGGSVLAWGCESATESVIENEVADDLAKEATSNPVDPEDHMVLTSTEIYSRAKELICRTWVVPPVHPCTFCNVWGFPVRRLLHPPAVLRLCTDLWTHGSGLVSLDQMGLVPPPLVTDTSITSGNPTNYIKVVIKPV